ncbi:hypothetical protein [Stenotrophomonas sp.]|uniref:hypothetical protein n=1 Tax=Stenotrophomonas sp. TaxID=69392 RepID=UPI0028A79168|nr:hypothetical protein [Stenotrophomonas sp.]
MKPWWLLLLCVAFPAMADDAIVFRCTDADDNVTVQGKPCPAGSHQVIQRMDAAPSRTEVSVSTSATPTPPAAPAPPVQRPAPAALPPQVPGKAQPMERMISEAYQTPAGTAILDSATLPKPGDVSTTGASDKPPLPDIYQCQGRDGGRYLHEREPAPPHCELMSVTGLGGVTPVNAASCEVIRDDCQPLPEDQRCSAWQQRFRDARGRERFASPDSLAAASTERTRLQAVLSDSNCAVPQ